MHRHSGLGVGCTNDGMNLTFSAVDERTDVTARIRYLSLLVRASEVYSSAAGEW